jgi:hypothetical protein
VTEFNPLLHLQPVNFRQGEWTPEAWDPAGPDNQPNSRLTVALPGEFATATCTKVVTRNAVVAQLGPCLMTGKGHDYKARDHVAVRREADGFGGERWVVVSERELMQNEMIQRFEAIERALAYRHRRRRRRRYRRRRENRWERPRTRKVLRRPIYRPKMPIALGARRRGREWLSESISERG